MIDGCGRFFWKVRVPVLEEDGTQEASILVYLGTIYPFLLFLILKEEKPDFSLGLTMKPWQKIKTAFLTQGKTQGRAMRTGAFISCFAE